MVNAKGFGCFKSIKCNIRQAISSVNKAIYENAQYPLIFNFQTEYQN